jgi:endoglucanase
MTAKKKITDKNGVQVFPITHTKAVIDDNGNSVEERLEEQMDVINQKQLEIGAVQSDITPTAGSTNWVTSGGVYDALKTENIKYDNSQSGLAADNVQGALDEVGQETRQNLGRVGNLTSKPTKSNGYINSTNQWVLSNDFYGYWFDVTDYQGYLLKLKANNNVRTIAGFTSEIVTQEGSMTYLGGDERIVVEIGMESSTLIPNNNGKVYLWVFTKSGSQTADPEIFDIYESISLEVKKLNNERVASYNNYIDIAPSFTASKAIRSLKTHQNYGKMEWSGTDYCASDYIDVSSWAGKTIRMRMPTFAVNSTIGVCFYTGKDESTVIQGITCNNTGIVGVEDRLITIPNDAVYMRTTYVVEDAHIYIPFLIALFGHEDKLSDFVHELRGNDGNMQLRRELFDYARKYKSYHQSDDTIWNVAGMLLTKDDYTHHGRLKMLYNKLVDENNNQLTLRGVNTGPYICDTYRFNTEALQSLKYYGVNYLRINVYIHWSYDETIAYLYSAENIAKYDAAIEEIVENCTALGIYVLIGWHSHSMHNPQSADTDLAAQKVFFQKFSEKFGDYGNVMFELHNEPWNDTAASLIAGMKECYDIIRNNSPYAVIMTGYGSDGGQAMINQLASNNMSDVFVSYHPYLPQDGLTTKATIDSYINGVLNKPILFTEFGGRSLNSVGNNPMTEYFMRKCEENHILNGFWCYADNLGYFARTEIWDSQMNYHKLIDTKEFLSHGGYTDGLLTKDGQTYLLVYRDLAFGIPYHNDAELFGKKIGLIGDSIAANGGFITKACQLLGATFKNAAIGGWFLGNKESKAIYKQINGVSPATTQLDGDEDLIVIFAGTNDFGHSFTIGEPYITDADGHRSYNTDANTTCGGLALAIQTLYTKYDGYIPIVICTPLQRSLAVTSSSGGSWDKNSINKYMDDYIEAITSVATYYGIPVCDFYHCNMNPNIPAANTLYFADGLHPNAAGHSVMGQLLANFLVNNAFTLS